MEKFKLAELPEIPDCPHQPTDFKFPKRAFGKAMRSCQSTWFKEFTFLHYDEANDLLFCHTCVSALRQRKMKGNSAEPAFVSAYDISRH